ncbi:MAG: transposase [Salinibacter sp.]|uniref:transposase n=1 Tax=Salinibacter sp. TaxID=2065818 RepID=UPI0035D44543
MHLTLGQQGRTLLPEDTPRSKDSDEKAGEKASSDPGETNQTAEAGQTAKAGSKHRDSRKSRERGFSERGRGSWSGDWPPAVLWVERGGEGRVLELQPDAGQKTLVRSALRHVEPGSRIDTDDFSGYGLLEGAYDHRSVDHEETYVSEEDMHRNTAEGEWSIFTVVARIPWSSEAPCLPLPQRVFVSTEPLLGLSAKAAPPDGAHLHAHRDATLTQNAPPQAARCQSLRRVYRQLPRTILTMLCPSVRKESTERGACTHQRSVKPSVPRSTTPRSTTSLSHRP